MDNLSEEEKKAIVLVQEMVRKSNLLYKINKRGKKEIRFEVNSNYYNAIEILLKLIEKQNKEIEHLKNLNEHQSKDMTKAVNYTFELNKEIEIKDKMIEEMAKEINKTTSEKYKIKHICEKGKCRNEECHEDDWNECIKEYFRNEVKNNESND